MKLLKVQIRITGKTGEIDGVMESVLGVLALSDVLVSHRLSKRTRPNGTTQLYIDAHLYPMPLGNLGESDIPERTTDDD